jgi:hypothetical protein
VKAQSLAGCNKAKLAELIGLGRRPKKITQEEVAMLINPAKSIRIIGLAGALALVAVAPASLSAAPIHHHPAKYATSHSESGESGLSKNAADEQSSESCWKMTDSDHNYGYNVPCSARGALQHH